MLDTLRTKFGLFWPQFTWKVFRWLSNRKVVTLVLLVFAVVMLLAVGPAYKRQTLFAGLILIGGYWLIISPLFSKPAIQLLTSFVPPDTGEPVDAVVVLARNPYIQGDRYSTAVDMIENGRADRLLIIGNHQGKRVFQGLVQRNLSPEVLMSAMSARTTKQEAYLAAAALGNRGFNKIILITDPPHMLRAWLTFQGLGFTVIPHIEPLPSSVPHHNRSFLAIREYLGLVSYGALGRFQRASAHDLSQRASALAKHLPLERCFMTADQIRQSLSSH